jgi:hypothetical protein
MLESDSVTFSTQEATAAPAGNRPTRARKKKGSLGATLDPLLVPRLSPGQPGRPKGSANYEWTAEADGLLADLCQKWGPTKAKHIIQRRLQEFRIGDSEIRPDSIRRAVERRMAKLGLPTGRQRRPQTSRTAKRWTDAQITALLGALGADATIESVAARTGHTVKSVHAKLARLDYRGHEVSGFAVYTVDQVSSLLHATPRQIRRWKEKGWLETKDRRITERALGRFLRAHADVITFATLPRDAQVYLVDLGYPCAESATFRKNVKEILDSVGRQRKHRRKANASEVVVGASVDDANETPAAAPSTAVSRSAD